MLNNLAALDTKAGRGRLKRTLPFKFRQLLLPLLFLSAAFAACYSLLNWLLVARTGLLPLDEDVVGYWVPAGLAWLLVIVFYQKRLNTITTGSNDRLPSLYHMVAVIVVAVPTVLAQQFIARATGTLTHISDLAEVASGPRTRFYQVDRGCVDGQHARVRPEIHGVGKNNSSLRFLLYVAAPVCGHGNDADHQAVWIGLQYEKHSDTKPGSAQAEVEFQSFLRQSELEFSRDNLHNYQYLEATERNASRKAFDKALHDGGMSDISRVTILTPRRGDFAARTGNVLEWAIGSYAIGAVLWMLMLLPVGLDPKKVKRLVRPGSASVLYDASPALALVIPSRQSFGLPLLVDLNVAVFVAMVLAGLGFVDFQADDLLSWGANYRPAVHGFGTLRLVSSQFVHGGLMHLANNMYGLMFAGIFLTPVVKNGRLLVCYLLAGLSGSVASVWAHPATISVGASGAIFGLYGVLLVLLAFRDPRIEAGRQVVLINAGIFVGFNLLIGSVSRGIDNAAHIGGLAAGLMIGLVIYSLDRAHRSTHEPTRQ